MYKIIIDTENAAFDGKDADIEIARILRELAEDVEQGGVENITLRDVNGNSIGYAKRCNNARE